MGLVLYWVEIRLGAEVTFRMLFSSFSHRVSCRRMARAKASRDLRSRRTKRTSLESLEPRRVLAAGPLITEFLAVNDSELADGDGVFSDWIEIHNPTSSALSLDGWHLTDDRDDLSQWPLPNVNLDGGEYLVVFASGQDVDDYVDAKGNYHTNFRLDGAGGDLLLVEPGGVNYDTTFLDYPEQSADISFGISIDGVSETLLSSSAPLSYRVPTVGDHPTTWTGVDFDDSQFTQQQTVAGSGLLITEITTGDETKSVEIQNVSDAVIDTVGWTVVINDPSQGPSGVANRSWSLPRYVDSAEILYRTDQVTDQYWGASIPWELDGSGWAMIVSDEGEVQDTVIWGYTAAQIATIRVDVGPHQGLVLANHWQGDGAPVGATGGVITDPVMIGSGANLAGANEIDTSGVRLNVEPEYLQSLPAGTYDVQEISMAASSDGNGSLRTFLAVATGGTSYRTIWVSPATSPAAGNSIHAVKYGAGSQQFTLDSKADVYAGAWHDGSAKVRFSRTATVTNHDNSPITPTRAGQTISDFSHGALNDRTYAYEVTVGTGGSATTVLTRTGIVDDDVADNFVRADSSTLGTQNPDSGPLFGGVVPTIAGIGFGGGDPRLEDLIQTDVAAAMQGTTPSLWTRFEFNSADVTTYDELTLRARYDDGFQAYLDGVPLEARNAPADLTFDSAATATRTPAAAMTFEDIDVGEALSQLGAGNHVLAVHLLNASVDDPDLLLQMELLASSEGTGQFFADATPGKASVEAGYNSVADTKFSADRGFYDAPVDVSITTTTPDASIIYTLDGTPPEVSSNGTIRNGLEYIAPITVASTTTLRALAYKSGLRSSNVDTQTYLFPSDIIEQTSRATIDAGFPSRWGGRGADYGLDPDVLGPNDSYDGVYAASFAEDLKSLPTISLVLDIDDMFGSRGIYSNVGSRGQAWERPVSAELIYPDGTEGFQIDAGIRMHGGASRSLSRKNNMRLLFKEQYGETKLDYPWFGNGVDRFDTVVLRAHFNDGWGWGGAGGDPLFARDQWHRQTQAAMGHTAAGYAYAHLYINGIYWGLYNPSERPDASFAAQHLGGDKTEWDAMNHNGVVDGSSSAWNRMQSLARSVDTASGTASKWAAYQRLQGNDSNGNNNASREDYLDIENYIDYLLISFYSGNDDWPGRNWYAARRRGEESEGYQFFAWDSEISMDLSNRTHLNENVIRDANNQPQDAAQAYGSLRRYDEFQLAFADRVHKHFFNHGVFYVDPNNSNWDPANPERNMPAARMVEITDLVAPAIGPESARWGDQHRSTPYTRDAEWQSELDYMLRTFFPRRSAIVMNQLRAENLYPDTEAPEFEVDGARQHGGAVPAGSLIGLDNPNGGQGTIWFTTDGSDPRQPGGAVNTASATQFTDTFSLLESGTLKARTLIGTEWSALTEAFFTFDQSGMRVSEVHFNPAEPTAAELAVNPSFDNDDFEFIEFVNVGDATINLEGVQLIDGVEFQFSDGPTSRLTPSQRVVVVNNREAFSTRYADVLASITIAGEYEGSLNNGGEIVKAVDVLGETLFEFDYQDDWFGLVDGEGYSLTVRNPSDTSTELDDAASWRTSRLIGGSPGAADTGVDAAGLVIHELLATSDGSGWLELHNTTGQPIDIGHWYLADSAEQLRKYQFPAGTTVPARGYLVVDEATQFGNGSTDPGALEPFGLSRFGGQIYLSGGDQQGRLLGYREDQAYTSAEVGVTLGRYVKSTSATDFVRLQSPTAGAANDDPIVGPVVINEMMYHPVADESEFIELWNTSETPLQLGNGPGRSWRVRGAIDFEFSPDAQLAAGGFGVLLQQSEAGDPTADEAAFRLRHRIDAAVPIWIYSAEIHGNLNNDGEKIFLEMPIEDLPLGAYGIVDAVKYNDQLPWALQPDGLGPSLSRFDGLAYGNDVASWGVSTSGGTPGRENAYEDTTPPTQPTDLVGRVENSSTVALAWTASSDDESGIDHYRIYRDGQVVGTSVVTRFTGDLQFSSSAPNRYRVAAVNGDGLEGEATLESVVFGAQVAAFQQGANGYRGASDAEIREGDPDSNNGLTDRDLEVDGEDGGTELSILLRWDNLSVPADAVVVGAFITLDVSNPGDEYGVYQMRKDWNESQVTWNNSTTDQSWQVGGARGASDRGSQVGTLNGSNGTVVIDMNPSGLAMVQSWLANPAASNHGVVIANPQRATDGVDLYSREHSTVSQRPKLSILYSPAPRPSKPGDFNLDEAVDDADIAMLVTAIFTGSTDPAFNVDGNGVIDMQDYDHLVRTVLQVPYGDATLDGKFDSADLVAVFQAGEYEDGIAANSTWASGDWNGDQEFSSGDLVKAFQAGAYQQAARPIAAVVAESSTAVPDFGLPQIAAKFDGVIDRLAAALTSRSDPSSGNRDEGKLRDEAVRQLQQESTNPTADQLDDASKNGSLFRESRQASQLAVTPVASSKLSLLPLDSSPPKKI
ncbi:MAG: DNRLRE domain-containing protein [Planctomycetaceae bacterium]|nr:DNRLRE domain-containing protein [Planctomycetaceae bacterium]